MLTRKLRPPGLRCRFTSTCDVDAPVAKCRASCHFHERNHRYAWTHLLTRAPDSDQFCSPQTYRAIQSARLLSVHSGDTVGRKLCSINVGSSFLNVIVATFKTIPIMPASVLNCIEIGMDFGSPYYFFWQSLCEIDSTTLSTRRFQSAEASL